MRYDQWWECKFIAEGIIDQGEALRKDNEGPALFRVVEASGITANQDRGPIYYLFTGAGALECPS